MTQQAVLNAARRQRRLSFSHRFNFAPSDDLLDPPRTVKPKNTDKKQHAKNVLVAASLTFAIALTGCGDTRKPVAENTSNNQIENADTNQPDNRSMVIWNLPQNADLYWNGQITDSKGYRWDVAFIPGIAPTFRGVGRSYKRAGGYIRRFGTDGLFEDGEQNAVGGMYEIAGKTIFTDYMVKGIGRDYSHTNADIADLYHDKPFGWYAQVAGRAMWGYVLKPVGRLVTGTVGSAGTAVIATSVGAVEGVGRVAVATGDVAVMGTIYPAARLVWHQPAHALSIFSAEPKLEMDGHWGLHIIEYPKPVAQMSGEPQTTDAKTY